VQAIPTFKGTDNIGRAEKIFGRWQSGLDGLLQAGPGELGVHREWPLDGALASHIASIETIWTTFGNLLL